MKTTIEDLEKKILKHKALYYAGKAEISDERYDLLEEELRKLNPNHPVLKMVGSPLEDKSEKAKHQKKMLSLEKTYVLDELEKWIDKKEILSIVKIDGSSCSLLYENGNLVLGKTRGDGEWGENITKKCLYIQDLPKTISEKKNCEVRGEIYCDEEGFSHLVQEMKDLELIAPTSQRNIVAGILGRKEYINLARHLRFAAFDILEEKSHFKTENEKMRTLEKWGFFVPSFKTHTNMSSLKKHIEETEEFMSNGHFLIDGLVVTYNDLRLHEELGETNHHPRYKIAFKFKGDTKQTKIDHLEWGVSRNGILTPVAIVDPVELSGAMISRVTLHNFGMVKNFNLKKGDTIEIIRSGEVIPKFLSVVKSSNEKLSFPKKCPSCASILIEEDIWLRCESPLCPAQQKESILHYMREVNIEEISDKRLTEMMNKGLVKKIPDLYRIQEKDFLTLDKVKDKLAKKMLEQIEKTKEIDLISFLSALGIEGTSVNKIEKIVSRGYDTIEKIQALTTKEVESIEGFAEKTAQDFCEILKNKKDLIKELIKVGVHVKKTSIMVENVLNGQKFCITGELSVKRSDMEKKIKSLGGVLVNSVTKQTQFLLTNEVDSTSSKYVKAKELKIPVITENDFYKMIGDSHE
jgi:DNA ligase (NAD+)